MGTFAVHATHFLEIFFRFTIKSHAAFHFPCMQKKGHSNMDPKRKHQQRVYACGIYVESFALHATHFWQINFQFIIQSYAGFPFPCMQSKRALQHGTQKKMTLRLYDCKGIQVASFAVHATKFWKIYFHYIIESHAGFHFSSMQIKGYFNMGPKSEWQKRRWIVRSCGIQLDPST